MANCSACNAETSTVKSPTYTSSEMQRVVGNGFTPDDATLTRWMTDKNITREAAVSDWKRQVDASQTDWLLCSNCAARAAQYRRSGVEQKRLPRGLPWLIGAVALVVIVLIVNVLIPKAQARSLGGFDLDRAAVSAIAFSLDGSLLAAGDVEHRIKLFDVKTAKTLHMLQGHAATITGVAFSPDGALLASAGKENVIRLWDVKTGQLLKTLDGHTLAVTDVAFSPDGTLLASSSYDKLIKLWDVKTGEVVKTLEGHGDSVTSVAFSPNRQRLASASHDQTARLWDVQTGNVIATLSGHTGGLTRLAFSPDGALIATGGVDHTVKLWEGQTGKIARTLDGYTESIAGLDFSPDSQQLAVVTEGRTAQLWKVKTWELLRQFQPREDFTFTGIAFAPDGKTLAIANLLDVSLWDIDQTP